MGRSAALTVVIVFLGVACHSTSGGELPPAAVVLDVSPRAARAGDVVVIRGAGLGTPGEVRVGASAVTAEILEWTDRQVALRMPHVGTWGRTTIVLDPASSGVATASVWALATVDAMTEAWGAPAVLNLPGPAGSATGKIALAGADGRLWLWSPEALRPSPVSPRLTDLRQVSWSPDGGHVVAVDALGQAVAWEPRTKRLRGPFSLAGADPRVAEFGWEPGVAVSPGGTVLLVGGSSALRMWSLDDGTLVRTIALQYAWFPRVAFSGDGLWAVGATDDGRLLIYSTTAGTEDALIEWGVAGATALAVHPDGKLIAVADSEGVITLVGRSVGGWAMTQTVATDMGQIAELAFSFDGEMLAAAAALTTTMWRVTAGSISPLHSSVTLPALIWPATLSWSADGHAWATGGALVSLADGAVTEADGPLMGSTSVAFGPDGRTLVVGEASGSVGMSDSSGITWQTWPVTTAAVRSVAQAAPDKVLGYSANGVFRVTAGAAEILDLAPPNGLLADTHSSGATMAVGYADGTIDVVNPITGEMLAEYRFHANELRALALEVDGRATFSADASGVVILKTWDAPPQVMAGTCPAPLALGGSIELDRAAALCAGSGEALLLLWPSLAPDTPPKVLSGFDAAAPALAFSPDGGLVAVVDGTGLLRVLDTASGADVVTGAAVGLLRPGGIAWSPDFGRLAVAAPQGLAVFDVRLK